MSRISDRVQIMMQERWRESIPRAYQLGPKGGYSRSATSGEIVMPWPGDEIVERLLHEIGERAGH